MQTLQTPGIETCPLALHRPEIGGIETGPHCPTLELHRLPYIKEDLALAAPCCPIEKLPKFLHLALEEAGIKCSQDEQEAWLQALRDFATAHQVLELKPKLEIQVGVGCSKFHVDTLICRFLLIIAGEPTRLRHPDRLGEWQASRGKALWLKGKLHPAFAPGLEHASPPASPSSPRLLLVADLCAPQHK
jgi:hypothetical protein